MVSTVRQKKEGVVHLSYRRFGTFEGVFVPSLLSIFGIIMYLRLGWVVGQVGLIAALAIIALSNVISVSTGLSVASIVTNIRIGHGGAYSIITKSFGLEAGSAIGAPLYFAQAISTAFYIVGFAECWKYIFPGHDFLLVSLLAWLFILLISYFSARLAFRIQYAILAVIALSIGSILLGDSLPLPDAPNFTLPDFSFRHFFIVFSVFFPAVTGFMAGLSMSGELKDPKRSIPLGTLAAIGVSIVVYAVLAIWCGARISRTVLIENTNVMIDVGRWPLLVIAGIMGATLSSAINMCVTAPRTLLALSQKKIIPGIGLFSRRNSKGEPTAAILLTALVALITLLAGTLNQVAVILTMFFLVTYGLINFSVFVEQWIGIASFRPSFRIPKVVPILGWACCLGVMFLINPAFTWVAWLVIVLLYVALIRRETQSYSPDVRSGFFVFLSEQMAKAASRLPYYPKIWKPNIVTCVDSARTLRDCFSILFSIVYPSGRLTVLTFDEDLDKKEQSDSKEIVKPFEEEGIFSEQITVRQKNTAQNIGVSLQTLKATHFPPNTFFYVFPSWGSDTGQPESLMAQVCQEDLGLIILKQGPHGLKESPKMINLWIRKGSPNIDLSILVAFQLQKNWDGWIQLIQIVQVPEEKDDAIAYLTRLSELMRFPSNVDVRVLVGTFSEALSQAPEADINIFGMPEHPDLHFIRSGSQGVKTPILFLRDSPHESATA